jgi:hypothetical protein
LRTIASTTGSRVSPSTRSGLPVSRIFGRSPAETARSHRACGSSMLPVIPVSIPTRRTGPASIAK